MQCNAMQYNTIQGIVQKYINGTSIDSII